MITHLTSYGKSLQDKVYIDTQATGVSRTININCNLIRLKMPALSGSNLSTETKQIFHK